MEKSEGTTEHCESTMVQREEEMEQCEGTKVQHECTMA